MKYSIAALLLFNGLAVGQESPVLSLTTHIPLPNVKGRIDHASVDLKGQRLFVAAVANNTLEVIDLKAGQWVRTIKDLEEPQGVYYDPTTNRLFVACGGNGVTNVYDGTTFKLIASHKFPDDADNIRYDGRTKHVIVGYAGAKQLRKREEGRGGLGFLDTNAKLIREIVIDAHPESFRLEEKGTRLFVNVPDEQEIGVVDLANSAVVARWPVTASKNNFPMSLDEAHHRLIVAAWMPPRLLVFDTDSGKQVRPSKFRAIRMTCFTMRAKAGSACLRRWDFSTFSSKQISITMTGSRAILRLPAPGPASSCPRWENLFVSVRGEPNAEVRVYEAR